MACAHHAHTRRERNAAHVSCTVDGRRDTQPIMRATEERTPALAGLHCTRSDSVRACADSPPSIRRLSARPQDDSASAIAPSLRETPMDYSREAKPAQPATIERQTALTEHLHFDDRQDFENATRGLVAPVPNDGVVTNERGTTVLNLRLRVPGWGRADRHHQPKPAENVATQHERRLVQSHGQGLSSTRNGSREHDHHRR